MNLPPALSHGTFYILIALSRGELHGYDLGAVAQNDSLGSIQMKDGRLYQHVKKLVNEGLAEEAGTYPAGKLGKERLHYRITPTGTIRLKEELMRMEHAVKIGEHLARNRYLTSKSAPTARSLFQSSS